MFSLAFQRVFLRKASISLIFALTLGFLTVSFASAILYTIDTDNNSASDWASVPVFQTDPSGDVNPSCTGGDGKDDIIETFVATGPADPPTHIYFGVRTASPNAVSTANHQVAAYVDCWPDGTPPNGPEDNDVVIMYRGEPDHVIYGDGHWGEGGNDRPTPWYIIIDQYSEGGPEGEHPADGLDRVEWGMPFSDFDVIKQPLPEYEPNCGPDSEARIIFYTYKVTMFGSFDCDYDETVFAGFDIPTVVELNSLNAQSTSGGNDKLVVSAAAFLGALAVGGLGLLLLRKRNQSL